MLPVEVICTKVELEGDRLEENKQKRLFTNSKHAQYQTRNMQLVMLYINNGSAEQLYDPTLSWESRWSKSLS